MVGVAFFRGVGENDKRPEAADYPYEGMQVLFVVEEPGVAEVEGCAGTVAHDSGGLSSFIFSAFRCAAGAHFAAGQVADGCSVAFAHYFQKGGAD